jgi:hypothetical protein
LGALGRMERRNVGSAACVENCSTMLFRSTNIIFGGLGATISPTTIKTGLTLLSTRTLLPSEPSKGALASKPESYLYPGWAVFIIVTVGRRRRRTPANDNFDDLHPGFNAFQPECFWGQENCPRHSGDQVSAQVPSPDCLILRLA